MGDEGEKNEEDKDLELDLMAEQEYLRLVRQYRVLESDKEAYLDEANKALRRQRKIIDDLEDEQKQLTKSLSISNSKSNARKEEEHAANISQLSDERDQLKDKIEKEKLIIEELGEEIKSIEKQISNQRRKLKGLDKSLKPKSNSMASVDIGAIGQKVVLLENRLDGTMVGFNATLSQNSMIRSEIDSLVQERSTFNDLITKLQKKIQSNKKTISDITELAIQAYDQRDESQSKVAALKEKNEKDAAQCAGELKELQRTLERDEQLKDFLFQKSNERLLVSDLQDQDSTLKKQMGGKDKEKLKTTHKHKTAFEKIKIIVGNDTPLEKIVADFVKIEDQNFALFNYVTEMNNQVEGLQESISKLKKDISEAKGRGDEKERQQKEQLVRMEKKLNGSLQESELAESKLKLIESLIHKLQVGTANLYNVSCCNTTPILSLFGEQTSTELEEIVPKDNVIMYLDILFEKVIELKGVEQFLDYKYKRRESLKFRKTIKHTPESVKPPKQLACGQVFGNEEEDLQMACNMESDSRPFDMAALKTRAQALTAKEIANNQINSDTSSSISKKQKNAKQK